MDFVMFVDESGDHNLRAIHRDFPVFCLAGCVFERATYHAVVRPAVDALKMEFWGRTDIVLHSRPIRKREGDYVFLHDPAQRARFYTAIDELFAGLDFTILAIVLFKEDHVVRYGPQAQHPYHLALEMLLERYALLIERRGSRGSTGYVLAESRGKVEDQLLRKEYNRLRDRGTYYVRDLRRITSMKTLKKAENIAGLQIADLAAYPIAAKVLRPTRPQPAFDVLLPKIDRAAERGSGSVLGYGLKIFPQPTFEHYLLWGK